MKIHGEFPGGNITVVREDGDTVYLENQLRDSEEWFYWAFCVEGAQGKTLTFEMQRNRLGYWGPAVSHDFENWHWLEQCKDNSFTYTFASDEERVYFAHSFLYRPERLAAFAAERGLTVGELCKSRKGRSVPYVQIGTGERQIILTARHHACESTGSYVLEGLLEQLAAHPIPNTTVFCIPFVDYDGVVDGDQGKGRKPHDHNREYAPEETPLYPETAAIRAYAETHGCYYGFDFHSPWHYHKENDYPFLVHNSIEKQAQILRFSAILESKITPDALQYRSTYDHPPMVTWNTLPSRGFAYNMMHRPDCELAVTLETTYFGTEADPVSASKMLALGRSFAEAIRTYTEEV